MVHTIYLGTVLSKQILQKMVIEKIHIQTYSYIHALNIVMRAYNIQCYVLRIYIYLYNQLLKHSNEVKQDVIGNIL